MSKNDVGSLLPCPRLPGIERNERARLRSPQRLQTSTKLERTQTQRDAAERLVDADFPARWSCQVSKIEDGRTLHTPRLLALGTFSSRSVKASQYASVRFNGRYSLRWQREASIAVHSSRFYTTPTNPTYMQRSRGFPYHIEEERKPIALPDCSPG